MSEEERSAELTRYRQRLLGFDQTPLLPNPRMEDYDGFVLKPSLRGEF